MITILLFRHAHPLSNYTHITNNSTPFFDKTETKKDVPNLMPTFELIYILMGDDSIFIKPKKKRKTMKNCN